MKELVRDVKATMGIFEAEPGKPFGLLAEFSNPAALLHAAEKVRMAGFRYFDTHSPFPIHGMDRAMGLGQSKVGFITFGGGVTGLLIGTWLQWWTGAFDYPINVGGRPLFAVELSIPVMFELTILLSAFAAVGGMLALNGLPRPYNPLFYSRRFARATDDAFFLHIAAADKRFDLDKTRQLLVDLGALNVEVIEDHEITDQDRAAGHLASRTAHGATAHPVTEGGTVR
jgi:hypothetical protein